jgi:hypothetical protein
MNNYSTSNIYENFVYLFKKKQFNYFDNNFLLNDAFVGSNNLYTVIDFTNLRDNLKKNNFKLGYPTLYGTIYNFMFMDIVSIKWMIYDIFIISKSGTKKILPNIIYLAERLQINKIFYTNWDNANDHMKKKFTYNWNKFVVDSTSATKKINLQSLKSLTLFYLRWEKNKSAIKKLKISDACLKMLNINIEEMEDDFLRFNDQMEDFTYSETMFANEIDNCLNRIYKLLQPEFIYKYIYECFQKFRYTW